MWQGVVTQDSPVGFSTAEKAGNTFIDQEIKGRRLCVGTQQVVLMVAAYVSVNLIWGIHWREESWTDEREKMNIEGVNYEWTDWRDDVEGWMKGVVDGS